MEDPNVHLREFLDICRLQSINHLTPEGLKLLLFPFTLKDDAKRWLYSLPAGIITNWNEMTSKFLKQFFPAQLTKKLRREIQNFTQKDGDTLYEAWEEFQELQRKCPHHGITLDELVQAFYEGLDNTNKGQQNLTSATQALVTGQQANSKEITELKKQMGQVIDFMGKIHESGKLPGQTLPNPNAGQFKIVATRSGRVFEEPLLKKSEPSKDGEAESILMQDDEDIEEVYAEKQPDKEAVPQSERKSDHTAVHAEKKKVHEAEPLAVPADPKSTQAVLEKGKSSSSNGLVSTNVHARAPFPNRFAKSKHDEADHAMIELFKNVEVNMPLLECIQQNPKYAKFLKELCTNKRLPREKDVVVMNETISAVFQRKLPPKLKDPGSFSIPCTIGTHSFDKIMLDLGASINVMPSYLYADLGLGDLKNDDIIIRLADRSNKKVSCGVRPFIINIILPKGAYYLHDLDGILHRNLINDRYLKKHIVGDWEREDPSPTSTVHSATRHRVIAPSPSTRGQLGIED
ncbi:PREDICTED: uncharacterized protein LOC101307394 [Fragaria vesca subsp. vesca]